MYRRLVDTLIMPPPPPPAVLSLLSEEGGLGAGLRGDDVALRRAAAAATPASADHGEDDEAPAKPSKDASSAAGAVGAWPTQGSDVLVRLAQAMDLGLWPRNDTLVGPLSSAGSLRAHTTAASLGAARTPSASAAASGRAVASAAEVLGPAAHLARSATLGSAGAGNAPIPLGMSEPTVIVDSKRAA